jgi:hypothetical protein
MFVSALASLSAFTFGDELVLSDLSPRGPKTLLKWNLAEQSDRTEQTQEEDRIVTDRPHFSEASSLVGLGVTQIETGYSFFLDKQDGVTTRTHSFPEPLLRAGILAEWFEFRLGYNYLAQSISSPTAGNSTLSGSDDLYLAAKLALVEQAVRKSPSFLSCGCPRGARRSRRGKSCRGSTWHTVGSSTI